MAVDWEHLARANTHPLRVSILEVIGIDGGRTLSPKDLSVELGAPLGNVNYHATELVRDGLLELASERQVRGAIEHFYRQAANSNGTNGASTSRAPRAKSNSNGASASRVPRAKS
jgi:MarR family protein